MPMIKVLVKEPGKPAFFKEIESELEPAKTVVGGWIEVATISYNPSILMICNEEGKLKGLEHNFKLRGDSIVGTVFFARGTEEGEIVGLEDGDLEIIQRSTGIEVDKPVKISETTYEMCPQCMHGIEMPAEQPMNCPICGYYLLPCSTCWEEKENRKGCDWSEEDGCWRFPKGGLN